MRVSRFISKMAKRLPRLWNGILSYKLKSGRNGIHYRIDRPSQRQRSHFFKSPLVVSGWVIDRKLREAPRVRIQLGGHNHIPSTRSREDVQKAFAASHSLPADCGFELTIEMPVGLYRLKIEVETADRAWLLIYSSIVISLPSEFHVDPAASAYRRWMKTARRRVALERPELNAHCETMLEKPFFSVIVDARNSRGFRATERSIRNQIYQGWEIHVLVTDGHKTGRRAEWLGKSVIDDISASQVKGDFLVFVEAGDTLASNALYEFAGVLNAYPELDMVYADEGRKTLLGRHVQPFFKPDWSPDYLETFNYIGQPACYRTTVARRCLETTGYYDFVLRFTECSEKIHHLRQILLERPSARKFDREVHDDTTSKEIAALTGRLLRTGRQGVVSSGGGKSRYYEMAIDLKRRPLVSVVIPTAGKVVRYDGRTIDLVVNCVTQISERSTYRNFEIIVVDNGDLSPEKRDLLVQLGCQLVTYHEPTLNIPKKLNLGASLAKGEMLILMNDDIELVNDDWIERMLEHFEKKHVGVVGAKLLYPNGLLQHAGVVHNKGNPAHVRRLYPRDDQGYFFSTCGVRNFMAVTGACMMTPREVYRRVGGYSEELPISFNDIDYCLKVGELDLYTVYAPRAELVHLESQSREAVLDIRELNWYYARWGRQTVSDPFYNERCLTVASPTFEPCINPRWI